MVVLLLVVMPVKENANETAVPVAVAVLSIVTEFANVTLPIAVTAAVVLAESATTDENAAAVTGAVVAAEIVTVFVKVTLVPAPLGLAESVMVLFTVSTDCTVGTGVVGMPVPLTAMPRTIFTMSAAEKPEIVALNKADAIAPDEMKRQRARLKRAAKTTPLVISAATGEGVPEVLRALLAVIDQARGVAQPRAGVPEPAWQP